MKSHKNDIVHFIKILISEGYDMELLENKIKDELKDDNYKKLLNMLGDFTIRFLLEKVKKNKNEKEK